MCVICSASSTALTTHLLVGLINQAARLFGSDRFAYDICVTSGGTARIIVGSASATGWLRAQYEAIMVEV